MKYINYLTDDEFSKGFNTEFNNYTIRTKKIYGYIYRGDIHKNIVLGKEYNGVAEIKEGLSESDLLITSGYDGLNEGDAIQIKK